MMWSWLKLCSATADLSGWTSLMCLSCSLMRSWMELPKRKHITYKTRWKLKIKFTFFWLKNTVLKLGLPQNVEKSVRKQLHSVTYLWILPLSILIFITINYLRKKPPVKWVPGLSWGVKCGRGVLLTTHSPLVPQSWKSRAIPLPTLWATPGL